MWITSPPNFAKRNQQSKWKIPLPRLAPSRSDLAKAPRLRRNGFGGQASIRFLTLLFHLRHPIFKNKSAKVLPNPFLRDTRAERAVVGLIHSAILKIGSDLVE